MTVQWSTTLRNALLDQWESTIGTSAKIYIRSGAQPANCAAADSGTLLVEFDLNSDWAAAASGGSKGLNDLPFSAVAVGGSPTNAGHYRVKDSSGTTCHEQGSVTAGGGGGDVEIDNISIAAGQTVSITSWTKTAPGA